MRVAGRSAAETVHIILSVVSPLRMCGLTDTIRGFFVISILTLWFEDSRVQGVE
jgi:hypothetical protein